MYFILFIFVVLLIYLFVQKKVTLDLYKGHLFIWYDKVDRKTNKVNRVYLKVF